ncbi:MAG: putative ABC transporter periplasmic-binding protein [Methanosaeta sp. PtaU1.Bin055]|nr:MAG: putative ABC transporter periplasmic-binding protein [Methanosaeta sp. PtaU1.Bin055]
MMLSVNAEESQSEDTLVVATDSSFIMQGNMLFGIGPSGSTGTSAYENLLTKNRESGYDGWLAESWESNDDATEWTFHLVEAEWHDSEPFTSEDVEFTYNYITENELWLASVLSMVDHVDCPDDRTVVFHMKSPSPAFLDDLSHCPGIYIMPKHLWEDIDDPTHYVDEEWIGTGPFKFDSIVPDQYVKLVANADYHGEKPKVGEVIFKVIPNKDAQILALKSGEVDVVSEISPAVARSLEGSNGIEVFVALDTRGYELGFNLKNYPTDRLEFRKAMAHAIDREKICDIVFDGYATPTETTFLMPSVAYDFVNPDVPGDDYEYDLQKAGEMLDAAGFTDNDGDGWREGSDGEDVVMTIPVTGMGGDNSKIAEILREDWKDLGIKVDMKQVESSQEQNEYHNSNFFIVGMPYLMHDDVDDLTFFEVNSLFGKPNWYDYDEPEYNSLAEELRNTADRDERKEIGYRMQEMLAEDVPTVPICSSDAIFAYRADRFTGWEDVVPLYWYVDTKTLIHVRRA